MKLGGFIRILTWTYQADKFACVLGQVT